MRFLFQVFGIDGLLNRRFAFVGTHFEFVVKNSRVRKSGKELFEPLRYSMSKSKIERMAFHLSKDLLRCNILDILFKNEFGRLTINSEKEFLIQKIILEFRNTLNNGKNLLFDGGIGFLRTYPNTKDIMNLS